MSNMQTVQSIYAAFGRGDVPAILETLDPDVQWEYQHISTTVPWLQARRGRAQVGGFFAALGEITITRFVVNQVIDGGKTVVALVDIDLTVKRTGKQVTETDEVHIWQFDDKGRVIRFRHCVDTHAQHLAYTG